MSVDPRGSTRESRKARGIRRAFTGAELKLIRFYADEGLSISRTAKIVGRPVGSIRSAGNYYNIKFHCEETGAPYGNQNWKGRLKKTAKNRSTGSNRDC